MGKRVKGMSTDKKFKQIPSTAGKFATKVANVGGKDFSISLIAVVPPLMPFGNVLETPDIMGAAVPARLTYET